MRSLIFVVLLGCFLAAVRSFALFYKLNGDPRFCYKSKAVCEYDGDCVHFCKIKTERKLKVAECNRRLCSCCNKQRSLLSKMWHSIA
ncbi:hypothetical protein GE061_002985 [Apolygus lucorum]|uniref:Uncharacterized protein n=1 Tax=Apolygus lucorum TaxID=248454 RepID=A0A6A4JSD4_APOLU|nr:hypothetical protein GE061_002985 [Apolygus lucorum]